MVDIYDSIHFPRRAFRQRKANDGGVAFFRKRCYCIVPLSRRRLCAVVRFDECDGKIRPLRCNRTAFKTCYAFVSRAERACTGRKRGCGQPRCQYAGARQRGYAGRHRGDEGHARTFGRRFAGKRCHVHVSSRQCLEHTAASDNSHIAACGCRRGPAL